MRMVLVLAAAAALLGACKEKTPCDDNQVLRDDYCWAVDGGGAGSPFGQTCAASTDCVAPTTYCAIQPPATTGFCSALGCDTDPTLCPTRWTCMDLTPYGLAAHMCVPGM
jgi:hypothetical protein